MSLFFGVVSDHWYNDPRPTYGLMEIIRGAVDDSDKLSYRKDFPGIIKSMGLKEPKMVLAGLLSKIKRRAANAEKKGDLMLLCEEMTDLSGNQRETLGPACDEQGITPQWLREGLSISDDVNITNGIIAELYQYRKRHSITWKTVADEWWCKLFPKADIVLPRGTIMSSWETVDRKKQILGRDSFAEAKEMFLKEKYTHLTSKPSRPAEDVPLVDPPEALDINGDTIDTDDGYDTSSDSSISPYMLRRHGDTIAILHELLEHERKDKALLQQQLEESEVKRNTAENRASEAESASDSKEAALKKMAKEHKKECSKYERELQKAAKLQ